MYIFEDDPSELSRWIRDEIEYARQIKKGSRGLKVKRVQEWLNLHGFGVDIDSSFGNVTARAVTRFQENEGLDGTGVVNKETFEALVKPMKSTLEQRLDSSSGLEEAVLTYAQAHLERHPMEIGGQNRGPWVRLYMKGDEGAPWAWCAGFVTFLLKQATQSINESMPIDGSVSCDSLAAQAKKARLFVSEKNVDKLTLPAGSIFLVRRTETDWTHAGLVTETSGVAFDTIEGNTNDDGQREGYEVCARSRGYSGKDFILLQ